MKIHVQKKLTIGFAAILIAIGVIVSWIWLGDNTGIDAHNDSDMRPPQLNPRRTKIASYQPSNTPPSEKNAATDNDEEEPATNDEEREAEVDRLVDTFDNLTDQWMEPSSKGVTMDDVSRFVQQFNKVPSDRKEECLQRALNLIPDENVMLLAGVLMDKSQPKELIELVFNDVLNRDEDVKKPILKEIYKDKSHPCWADTAWIFDVTGENQK